MANKINLTVRETFNLAVKNHQGGKNDIALELYNQVLEIDPNHSSALNNLGVIYENLGENQKAKDCYEKAIEIKPDYVDAHNNLGSTFKYLGENLKAKSCYEKAIEINPNYVNAHHNLGVVFSELGENQKTIDHYQKALTLKPNHTISLYNLGIFFSSIKQYKNAAEKFKLINFRESKSYLLDCLYRLNDKSNFFKELDDLIKQDKTNAIIGSLISLSEIKYGVKRSNPFCADPLKYVLTTNLTKQYDFENVFIKPVKNALKECAFSNKSQGLLTNGLQTAGNLFNTKNNFLNKIKDIIHLELDKYHNYFKESKEGIIKNWPKSYSISAWLVIMNSGGKLDPHIHENGWLSGSIYINVPSKSETESGNLVVSINDQVAKEGDIKQKKVIDVVTGSLCLFPSSLYHYTIPFESKEDRIVLAFDVKHD